MASEKAGGVRHMRWIVWLLLLGLARAGDLSAQEQTSLMDKILNLRFGNEKNVVTKHGAVDLSRLTKEEYWRISGSIWFIPGHFLPPDQVFEIFEGERLQDLGAILLPINDRVRTRNFERELPHFGTYIIKFLNSPEANFELTSRPFETSQRLFLTDRKGAYQIDERGQVSQDPQQGIHSYPWNLPPSKFSTGGDFFLVIHTSTARGEARNTPNQSSFFISFQSLFSQTQYLKVLAVGTVLGSLLLAFIFYAFIYVFRTHDRSSLYLCLYALFSFVLACLIYFNSLLPPAWYLKVYSLVSLTGVCFLMLFFLEKIETYTRTCSLLRTTALGGTAICILFRFLDLRQAYILSVMAFQAFALGVVSVTIYLAIKHKISGTIYLITGALVSNALHFTVVYKVVTDANVEIGYANMLANFSMTVALALVNAREFADTFRNSEKMRRELERLVEEVKQKEEARTLFFQNTSHELRTPLNGIIGFMRLIGQGKYGNVPEAAEQHIQKCIRLAISLKHQVNTILDLAKSKKGNLLLHNSVISLSELSKEANDLAAGLLLNHEDRGFTLHRSWSQEQNLFIGDHDKIRAMIRNLLGNAFKFRDPERPNQVTLTIKRDEEHLIIEVQDTGIGIAPEHQSIIFEEFQQLAADARRAYEGTGLGLAMVKDYIRLMGGTVQVESQLGVGSHFTLNIPAQKEVHLQKDIVSLSDTEIGPLNPRQASPQQAVTTQHSYRIFVVDDHEMNCEVLKDLLEHEGYKVKAFIDGREALKWMRREPPDLVLLDLMMPFFSGEDTLRAMRAEDGLKDIPTILVTARASEDDRLFGLSLGADDYLAKPILHDEMLFRIRNLLSRLDIREKVVAAEAALKLAQLGQLMQEYSHELKNALQIDASREEIHAGACEAILLRLPASHQVWPRAAQAFSQDRIGSNRIRDLPFLDPSQKHSQTLRSLRGALSFLDLDLETQQLLWQHLQTLDPEQQSEYEHTIYIIRCFLTMHRQMTYLSNLVRGVLDFAKTGDATARSSPAELSKKVSLLIRPRIHRHGIMLEIKPSELEVAIDPGAFMQVMLNLLVNACDAIESLPQADRWIHVEVTSSNETVIVCVRNGGPPFSAALAEKIFQEKWTSKGSSGYGLGLGISRRLVARCGGELKLCTNTPHPEIHIHLPPPQELSTKQSA
jgi:signal transduction histidine kinase